MFKKGNLGKKIRLMLLTAMLGMAGVLTSVAAMPASIICAADFEEDEAVDEISTYCVELKTKNKPDKYTSKKLDDILSAAVSHIRANDGEDSEYIIRIKAQMDAIIDGASGEKTESYLFLADNFEIPTANYGEEVTIVLPVINYSSARLEEVVINPNMGKLVTDEWPFEIQNSGYTQVIKAIPPYDPAKDIVDLRQDLVYTFKVREDVQTGYYPVNFDVLYTRNNATVTGKITTYVNIVGKPEYGKKGQNKPEEDDEEKFVPQPRIIVTGFETSPTEIFAGDTFTVYIHVKNTSNNMPVKNVLFDMQAAVEGSDKTNTYSAFLPTSGSSSVYMDSIAPGGEKDIVIEMTAKADLAQKPYVLEVKMKYDYDKVANVSDTASVSIPIKQESKFDSSTPEVAPASIPVGSQSNIMFSIYNTGKTTLYNVQVKYKDDSLEGGEVFIGNLTSGSTGNVDSMVTGVTPNDSGTITAVISYEDEAGNVVETEKEINLSVYEESFDDMAWEDPGMMEGMDQEEKKGLPVVAMIGIGGGAALLLITLIVVLVKVSKKKKAKKQLEEDLSYIDEE